ncbi:hypothetical protein B0H14DRAFT_2628207 [Mycena olivaceomarginata]|nr:hypothetical protein B0H14DRAFT_2628207 [Mycena olivaceomarginata]
MPTSPTSQLGMPMSQRECDWDCPHIPYMLGMGMTITSIYGKAMVVPSWGGNDHPYYVWKCHGPSHFLYGNDHSYHVWKVWSVPFLQLGMTILAIYGSGVVLPIPSVGNGHYCHIWKVWKAWVAQLELLSVELVNLSQQSSWLLDYPLDPAVQQKWSPFAREYAGGAMDCSLIPPSVKQLSWECKMVLEAIINSLDYRVVIGCALKDLPVPRADASVGSRRMPCGCADYQLAYMADYDTNTMAQSLRQ